jgi:feruloyl esterase
MPAACYFAWGCFQYFGIAHVRSGVIQHRQQLCRQRHGAMRIGAGPIGNAVDTIHYYEEVGEKLQDAPASVRLFLAPGMGHCRGGIGPNAFDAIGALEKWVERDQPPEQIIALKSAATDRVGGLMVGEPDKTQGRTRPLCSYPLVASYKGTGSIDDAGNFRCSIRK